MIEGKIAGKPVHFESRQPAAEPGRMVPAMAAMAASPVAAVRWNEGTREGGVPNPLAAVEVVHRLKQQALELGAVPFISVDFNDFARQRAAARGTGPSPMFDPAVGRLHDKAFWLGARSMQGEIVSLQAYRLDYVDTSLAEWVVGWMAGLYLKRHELMVPAYLEPPPNTRAGRVHGWLVYHGEIWLSPTLKNRSYFDTMPFLGMLLAYLKWYPDAIWGLVNDQMANHGHVTRMKYPHLEPSFLRWQHCPEGIPNNEWLVLAERSDLDFLVEEKWLRGA
jgi:hypothetical protein